MPKKAAKAGAVKFKKAPGAPKRFKSAFMFFSEMRHKALREQSHDKKVLASDIAKVVSREWKCLRPHEKEEYEAKASEDRDRYYKEKAAYKGPWKIPNVKDPRAPKKPQSAFLAFSNERRKAVADANPGMGNAEISGVLSRLWKESPPEVKNVYREREAAQRKKFKETLVEYNKQSSTHDSSSCEDGESQSNNEKPSAASQSNQDDMVPPFASQGLPFITQRQHWPAMQQTVPLEHTISQTSNQFSMVESTSSAFALFLTPFPLQQHLITLPPAHVPASLPPNAFAAPANNQMLDSEEVASQQPLLYFPSAHVPAPFPTSSFGGFTCAVPLTGTSSYESGRTARPHTPMDRAASLQQRQQRHPGGDDAYPTLDPFIDTDTGGFLAAFAELERNKHDDKPN